LDIEGSVTLFPSKYNLRIKLEMIYDKARFLIWFKAERDQIEITLPKIGNINEQIKAWPSTENKVHIFKEQFKFGGETMDLG